MDVELSKVEAQWFCRKDRAKKKRSDTFEFVHLTDYCNTIIGTGLIQTNRPRRRQGICGFRFNSRVNKEPVETSCNPIHNLKENRRGEEFFCPSSISTSLLSLAALAPEHSHTSLCQLFSDPLCAPALFLEEITKIHPFVPGGAVFPLNTTPAVAPTITT